MRKRAIQAIISLAIAGYTLFICAGVARKSSYAFHGFNVAEFSMKIPGTSIYSNHIY